VLILVSAYFSAQLEYDVLEYVVIERLAQGGRDKLKEDGLNVSDWLQSLASFWGHLYVSIFFFLPSIYLFIILQVVFYTLSYWCCIQYQYFHFQLRGLKLICHFFGHAVLTHLRLCFQNVLTVK
jgi:hypothetical protein